MAMLALPSAARGTELLDFNRDIKPILSENCYYCHGPDAAERKAGLRLDQFESATAERDGVRAIVPGKPEESAMVRRIFSNDANEVMPPPKAKIALREDERAKLKAWIAAGAEYEQHWAFAPPVKSVKTEGNLVDALVKPSLPPAERHVLIRRATLDLAGLPPKPEETAAFLEDASPDAYEKLVDRLLASPAYGERMAWDWLDAARYADSNGYQGDNERTMWPWRDWVVRAFNANMPWDRFTVWQLAGDLLPEATDEQKLATGFCRNHPINGEGGRIAEENRVDYVMDMTETMGTVWLGLTLNCCRCHDHKFDPISQREYYQLSAFFNQTPVDGSGGDPRTAPNLRIPMPEQKRAIREIETALAKNKATLEKGLESEKERLEKERENLEKQLKKAQDRVPVVMVMGDRPEPRKTFLLRTGLYNKPGDEVSMDVPESLPAFGELPKNRLGLARWLVSPENPLTARVTVNRFWQQFFGIGLVKTPEDFGTQGETPPKQELLDALAVDFVESGWNVKRLVRQIATSMAYRQSAKAGADAFATDPGNRKLARGPRFRMPSPMIRDQALAASGLLVRKVGGAPVNPYQPAGIWEETSFGKKKYTQGKGDDLHRRSLYTFWRRIAAPTAFFDNASRTVCSVSPLRTNTPLHALYTFNDVTFVEAARALAENCIRKHDDIRARLDEVFVRILARAATDAEADALLPIFESSLAAFRDRPDRAEALLSIGETERDRAIDPAENAAWTSLCLAVFNLDEAVTKP